MKPAPNRAVISWRARAGDVADGFQAGAAQAAGDGLIGAERGYRQRTDGFGLLAIGDDLP